MRQVRPLSQDVMANLSIEELEEKLEMQMTHINEVQFCYDCSCDGGLCSGECVTVCHCHCVAFCCGTMADCGCDCSTLCCNPECPTLCGSECLTLCGALCAQLCSGEVPVFT